MARTYQIRKSEGGGQKRNQTLYRLTLPPELATRIPEGTEFVPEITDEGILYRVVREEAEPELPAWAKR